MTFLTLLAAEGEHHANGNQLAGDINEVIWGSIAFFVLLALLIKYAGPAIVKMFTGRTARIQNEIDEAKAQRAAAENAAAAEKSDLPDLADEERRILDEANESAARLRADIVTRAQTEADEIRSRGSAEVENYRRQAIADLTAEVSQLTKNSAEAVVRETLDDASQRDLIDRYITHLERT
ncbi:MAG: F0F1 ATP synthase subunit B [Acidimicrobiales bacterium]